MGLVTGPHARTPPHPQPVGSGPRHPVQRSGSRGWESAQPRTPHTQAGGAPPPGALAQPPKRAKPARKSARCRVGDGVPHARIPPHPQPVGSGPRQPAQRAGSRGWGSARPRTPHTQAGGAPPGTFMPPPQRAKLARKSARFGVCDTPAPRRTHSQWVVGPGSPPRKRAVGDGTAPDPGRPTPRQEAPHPRAPSCRPHSAQSQLEGARAVGLVTGPHARGPPHPQPVGSGPQQPAQRAGSRGWESARHRTPHTQAGGAPPGRPRAAPTARKASSKERALWGW